MKSMCRTLSLALACLLSGTSQAATVVDLLFQGVANAQVLTVADRQAIAALLPMAVGPAGLVDRECKQPSNPIVTVRDMNRDGRAEVIVVEGNGCIYGMMGKVVHALASDGQGRWRAIMLLMSAQLGLAFGRRSCPPSPASVTRFMAMPTLNKSTFSKVACPIQKCPMPAKTSRS